MRHSLTASDHSCLMAIIRMSLWLSKIDKYQLTELFLVPVANALGMFILILKPLRLPEADMIKKPKKQFHILPNSLVINFSKKRTYILNRKTYNVTGKFAVVSRDSTLVIILTWLLDSARIDCVTILDHL